MNTFRRAFDPGTRVVAHRIGIAQMIEENRDGGNLRANGSDCKV